MTHSSGDERHDAAPTVSAHDPRPGRQTVRGGCLVLLHRWPTALAVALVVTTFVDGVPPLAFLAGLLVVMPVCYLIFGSLRGELHRPGALTLQTAGLLGFAALALVALAVDETLGLGLVAAGWLAHAVWDFAHYRSGRVVPRAWSEWCGVVDACGAVTILVLTL
ncbi:hypothetical protein [Streptomyces sp. NPDC007369]|uniref:hypothetical protein n=1 Tax=Streptomyces sp. NPDC007369 TaxID=3154589 RepID=UPI0033D31CFA